MPAYLLSTKGYGFTVEMINESCPTDLEPYLNAYKLEVKKKDENNWMLGMYIQSAVSTAVEHNFAGRKAKSKYIDLPFMQQLEEREIKENLTEEEKVKQTEQLFRRFKIMQTNFELSKKK